MDKKDSNSKSTFGRDDRGGSSFFRSRRDRDAGNNNTEHNDAPRRDSAPRERFDSKPRFSGDKDREFKPRFGGGDRDSKPRFSGDKDREFKPRFGGGDRDSKPRFGGDKDREFKPRFGGGDRDSKPRFGGDKDREFKPRFGGGDRDSKPRFGGDKPGYANDRPRFGGDKDREFKPRFGGGDRDSKPRLGGGDRPRFGGDKPSYANDRPRFSSDKDRKARYEEKANAMPSEMRLNRFIAMSGVCSRREADNLILAGEVTVNGVMIDILGSKVNTSDDIRLNGERLQGERKVYIILNKPKDYVTTVEDPHADRTVMDLLKGECPERIYPVGRLDRNTTGVLLLTNDGSLTKELTHPSYEKKKIYHVFLNKPCTEEDLQKLASNIELEDGSVHADEVSFVENNPTEVGVELHSGRNRIVRRMFESLGYEVVKLDRVYFAGLTKMGLRRGFWRHLTAREVSALKSGSYE